METDIFTNIKIIIYEVKVYKNDKATHFYYNFFFSKGRTVISSLVSLENRDTRSTCPTSVFTGTGQSDKR